MATMLPHLHIAIGGVRVVAPEGLIGEARDVIARARDGAFAVEVDRSADWRLDASPGKVGDLDEDEVGGVLKPAKTIGAIAVGLLGLFYVLSGCPA